MQGVLRSAWVSSLAEPVVTCARWRGAVRSSFVRTTLIARLPPGRAVSARLPGCQSLKSPTALTVLSRLVRRKNGCDLGTSLANTARHHDADLLVRAGISCRFLRALMAPASCGDREWLEFTPTAVASVQGAVLGTCSCCRGRMWLLLYPRLAGGLMEPASIKLWACDRGPAWPAASRRRPS